MQFSAEQIASIIHGKIEGNPEASVTSFGKIEDAAEGQLTFLANPKYEDFVYTTHASIIIVNESHIFHDTVHSTLIRVKDSYSAFAELLTRYQELSSQVKYGIQQPSYMASSVTLGNPVFIGAFSYLGENVQIGNRVQIYPGVYLGDNVKVGDDTILYPGVKIYHDCVVGSHVTIHAGTIIGGDGFGFAPQADGTFKKIPQIGNVVIEDWVEIGTNTTIDRSTMGSTRIGRGVKLDNLIQIAHNVEIGTNTVIAAQAGISGSTKIGQNVVIGGQAGIVGHLLISDGSRINAQSGVTKSIKKPQMAVTGTPAFNYVAALKSQVAVRNLPELEKKVAMLEEKLNALLNEKK